MPLEYVPVSLPELFVPGEYGLSSVINWVNSTDSHWQGGIQYDTNCTETLVTMAPCISGVPDPVPTKTISWSRDTRGARPFTVYDRSDCSAAGSDWFENGQSQVLRALRNSGPTQLERTFWTGAGGASPALVFPNLTTIGPIMDNNNQILLQPASTLVSGVVPLDITEALGVLEAALGDCFDGVGVIHVPKRLGPALSARNLIYKEGTKLYTYCGNMVAIGRGYPSNFGPNGAVPPAGSTWMFGTSPIFGYRGTSRAFTARESLNRAINTVSFIAEQTYLLGWECCLVGVLTTTGGETAGAPGTPSQST